MIADKLKLLSDELSDMACAATHLRFSIDRTQNLFAGKNWQPDELGCLASLAGRFTRLPDLLTQRIMRLVDELELVPIGTLLDRINVLKPPVARDDASMLVRIRELRNLIAHEYVADRRPKYTPPSPFSPPNCLGSCPTSKSTGKVLINRYSQIATR